MDDLLSQSDVARELGCTFKTVTRLVADRKLGPVIERIGRNHVRGKFLSRSAVEAFSGRKIEVQAKKDAEALDYRLTLLDILGIARAGAEFRDRAWLEWLAERRIAPGGLPPFADIQAADLNLPTNLFTRAQVLDIVERAARVRDTEWNRHITPPPFDPLHLKEEKS